MNNQQLRELSEQYTAVSTYLVTFGYNSATQQLAAKWKDGATIVYSGVPSETVTALLESTNAGKLLRDEAKAASWPYRKVCCRRKTNTHNK